MSQRTELINRLRTARQKFEPLLANVPTNKFIYPNWTIKQYLDHISGWDDAIVMALQCHAKNEPVPLTAARGINAYNADTVTTRETIDLDHTRREFNASRKAVMRALEELPEEKFSEPITYPWGGTGTVEEFIDIFVEHDEEHAEHLEEWLKHPDQPITGKH